MNCFKKINLQLNFQEKIVRNYISNVKNVWVKIKCVVFIGYFSLLCRNIYNFRAKVLNVIIIKQNI